VNGKKLAGWAVVALLGYFVVTDPHGAAHLAHQAMGWLQQAGAAAVTFLSSL